MEGEKRLPEDDLAMRISDFFRGEARKQGRLPGEKDLKPFEDLDEESKELFRAPYNFLIILKNGYLIRHLLFIT